MPFSFSSPLSVLKKFLNKIPSLARTDRHSLSWLNITQSLGVINDNVFKFAMAFLLIDTLGRAEASTIVSATGAIYVIPFLLFSSSAGILADRFSKQQLLVMIKGIEIIVMILALFAFSMKSVWACYALLFLLATHSAMFGPSKYGIIAELVPTDKVLRANGLIASFTYLAIIIGTFLASFLTEISGRHFTLIAGFCLLVAIGGFVSSLFIKHTLPQGSEKKVNIFFVREIFRTLVDCRKYRHLLPSIFSSSYFLFIGAFTQLNIIPFALDALHLSEIAGGYLFLATSLGIALGSYLAGRASRRRIELGLSCFAGIGIALFFILLSTFSEHLWGVIFSLICIGVLGGIFIVPFDTFIQLNSPGAQRGQTIAAANFLSFAGVLIASIVLYLFNQLFDFSSATGFYLIGILTLLVSLILTLRLSDFSLPYFSRTVLQKLFSFQPPDVSQMTPSRTVLILEKGSWLTALFVLGTFPQAHLFVPRSENSNRLRWLRLFYSIHYIPYENNFETLLVALKPYQKEGILPCLLLSSPPSEKLREAGPRLFSFFKRSSEEIFLVSAHHPSPGSRLTLFFSALNS